MYGFVHKATSLLKLTFLIEHLKFSEILIKNKALLSPTALKRGEIGQIRKWWIMDEFGGCLIS